MQQPSDAASNRQPTSDLRSPADHDIWWSRVGSRQAFVAWLRELSPNLAIHLVPQEKSFTDKHVRDLAERWCNEVQKECFGRNRRKHQGKIVLFVEYSEAVGWHAHGAASMPGAAASTVIQSGEIWLREQSTRYVSKALEPRFESDSRNAPTASIYTLSTEADRDRTINYAVKNWAVSGKLDRVVPSGCSLPRA